MADKKLTDLTEKVSGSLRETDVHYMVDTTDTASDPAGTSYKCTLGSIFDSLQSERGGIVDGIATLDSLGKLNDSQSQNSDVIPYDNSTGFLETSDNKVDLALNRLSNFIATTGQVKVNAGNGIQPTTSNTATSAGVPSTEQLFNYDLPLSLSSSPTTTWPKMESSQVDASIWNDTNTSFLENKSLGQTHIWRLLISYNKPSAASAKFIINIRLYNELSGFQLIESTYISEETVSGNFTLQFITIADGASLPSPLGTGNGYKISTSIVGDNGSDCDITLDSITRISLFNAYVAP